jgi:hypothetical protein
MDMPPPAVPGGISEGIGGGLARDRRFSRIWESLEFSLTFPEISVN